MIYHICIDLYVQVSSPYVSLEMLDDPDYIEAKEQRSPNHRIYSSDSSTDTSSGIQMVVKPKLLKRPKRPVNKIVRGRLTKSSSNNKVSIIKFHYT